MLKGMPSQCPCGQNNVRDFKANLLKTTLTNVEIEPKLQKIDNEGLNGLTSDDARPDVWRQGQNAFFDIRLTNSNARSLKHLAASPILKKDENKIESS